MAVDTHVFRVSNRIGIVDTQTPEKNRVCSYGCHTKEKMVSLSSFINISWKKNLQKLESQSVKFVNNQIALNTIRTTF